MILLLLLITLAYSDVAPIANKLRCYDSFKRIVYFHHEQIMANCISTTAGRLVYQGKPLSTGERGFIFVVTLQDQFVVSADVPGRIHHTSLSGGQEVKAAGRVWAKDGLLLAINNHSGHYRPSRESVVFALELLERLGADTYLTVFREVI